jgi:hypothetical protein
VGQCLRDDEQSFARFQLDDPRIQFAPTSRLLREILRACYLDVTSTAFLSDVKMEVRLRIVRPPDLLRLAKAAVKDKHSAAKTALASTDNVLMVAQPFVGENNFHQYKPPFGLARFDPRWA